MAVKRIEEMNDMETEGYHEVSSCTEISGKEDEVCHQRLEWRNWVEMNGKVGCIAFYWVPGQGHVHEHALEVEFITWRRLYEPSAREWTSSL